MAVSDKNISIVTADGVADPAEPRIIFSGADSSAGPDDITLYASFDGSITTLSWEGSAGQLFSISNDLSGTIFSVNDVSGIPSIEVDDDGTVRLAEFAGNVLVGYGTDQNTGKMQVNGTIDGTATSALYADVAERYAVEEELAPGTVVIFGGEQEIKISEQELDHRVAGVISTDPAYMMNSQAGNDSTHPYVALTGRVPCKVTGPVAEGDLMVTSNVPGHAKAENFAPAGRILGKALGRSEGGETVIEVLVNLM